MIRYLRLSLFALCAISAQAQTFIDDKEICASCSKDFNFVIESTSFLKNNEYFGDFTKGFTGIGFFLKPQLEYFLNHNTKLNLGIFLTKYSGHDKFTDILPLFTVSHEITTGFQVVFGSIYGTLNHELIEPLFRFDRYYQNQIEYGLQFLFDNGISKSDLWVSWERFIFNEDPFQEEFVIGNTTKLKLFNLGSVELFLPIQFLVYHRGGQIDHSSRPKYSTFNAVFGFQVQYKHFSAASFYAIFNHMHYNSSILNGQLESGNGYLFNLSYNTTNLSTSLGYWVADNFYAPKGEFLYQSYSDITNSFVSKRRELITKQIAYKNSIGKSIKLEAGINGYFDAINSHFDYSFGFYMVIDETILIKNLAKND